LAKNTIVVGEKELPPHEIVVPLHRNSRGALPIEGDRTSPELPLLPSMTLASPMQV